ncbi:MAG: glycosyltransferase [Sedimenticola thiotaurini]|uniref:Glycosyltransferase n=1 Tax=Sedimenticola thiotaurini TaxID=1543721 RepID=A0A558DAT0_9GAMM|nr:MAG: glycosyltransferase [Sedimenticola thiotaurini]
MKVALVDVNYGSSSTGKIVADLVTGLTQRGHQAIAFYGRDSGIGDTGGAVKISSSVEVLFHAFATRVSGLTDGFSHFSTRRLIRQLELFEPDVVHLHDIHGYFVDIPDLCTYLKSKRIATVWTFHCEFMYTGRCGYAMECEEWRSGCKQCPDLSRYPKTLFFDFAGWMYQRKRNLFADFRRLQLVAPSEWLASRMRQSMIRDKPISVVLNGLNTRIFRPHDVGGLRTEMGLEGKYCVLSVGADLLSERKGGRWVVELAKRFERDELVFLMVGVDSLPSSMPENVIMLPRIEDQTKLAELYSLGSVLLLPSEKETFSMVSAEALACGLPVVGFDSGAPREVAPENFGSFVPYGDLDALEALLRTVCSGTDGLKSAAECVKFAESRYSQKAMVMAYEAIYQRVIESK